jgi:hypothetical protein
MLNQMEKSILKKIAENHLITKPELRKYLETNGSANRDVSSVVDGVTRRLMEQRLISAINPVGSTCYIITQRGAQFLKEMEI